jgi:outer membrane protein assembly factor BamD
MLRASDGAQSRHFPGEIFLAAAPFFLLMVLVCGGCGRGHGPAHAPGAQGEFLRARQAYERGDHMQAIEQLEAFERRHPGSQFIDDALFFLGKAHQANHEQLLARQAFTRLIEAFPRSGYTEAAYFEIADCWFREMRGPALDPEPAEEALRTFRVYLGRYPKGEHVALAREAIESVLMNLAEKDYLNGRTYMRLGRPAAARRYFRKAFERHPEGPIGAKCLEGLARSCEEEERWAEARESYRQLLDLLGSDPERFTDGPEIARRARQKLASLPQ